ncbi:hypothetical protein KVG29_07295 [Caldicoprobacter algeriensis]|uniref:hypothetical protein n=1 Tax=Caldicoprobacter algeriensis TaxID=699281 RepID=UPI00207AB058|nr:hypothetical protein [Caldicoprobacter algeriensis]MCM8901034.1 hypothetical protein [Caldicoprobacter algeriensis]
MKNKKYVIPIILFLAAFMIGCSARPPLALDVSRTNDDDNDKAHEGYSAIMFMTDLEIIKRATDHLKSHGEKVAFEETEISIHHCDTETVICTDPKGNRITYKGDYLKIVFYPPSKPLNPEYNKCFTVYLDQEGDVLGYTSQTVQGD